MSRYPAKRSRGGGSRGQVDPALELRDLTTRLYDTGDGHGTDWVAAAIASFRVSFYALQNIPADSADRAAITRRAHDFAYNLMAGTPDSGTPFTAGGARPERAAFTMTDPEPGHDPHRP